jgi:hypothetical protein
MNSVTHLSSSVQAQCEKAIGKHIPFSAWSIIAHLLSVEPNSIQKYSQKCLKFLLSFPDYDQSQPTQQSSQVSQSPQQPTSPQPNDTSNTGSHAWLNWWLPKEFSIGKGVHYLSLRYITVWLLYRCGKFTKTKRFQEGQLWKKNIYIRLTEGTISVYWYAVQEMKLIGLFQDLHELNALQHEIQLSLLHQYIQEQMVSSLLPRLKAMSVNDRNFIPLFSLLYSAICSDNGQEGRELCCFLPD